VNITRCSFTRHEVTSVVKLGSEGYSASLEETERVVELCTFASNRRLLRGAVEATNAVVKIRQCTFWNNTSDDEDRDGREGFLLRCEESRCESIANLIGSRRPYYL